MKRILVGFDGSEGSEHALNRAQMLIAEHGELILLAVVPSPENKSLVDADAYKKLKQKAENLLAQVVSDLGPHDFTITSMVKEGDVAATIIEVANECKCDLIVLGSRGTSEIGQYLIGSVANKVVQYAAKPVMVVR